MSEENVESLLQKLAPIYVDFSIQESYNSAVSGSLYMSLVGPMPIGALCYTLGTTRNLYQEVIIVAKLLSMAKKCNISTNQDNDYG